MIYPLADPDLPFLGIHLTKTANGDIEAGPNAVLAFSKEGYKWTDINFVDLTKVLLSLECSNLEKNISGQVSLKCTDP